MKTTLHIQRFEPWMPEGVARLGSTWVKWVNPPAGRRPYFGVNLDVRIWTDDIDAQHIAQGEAGGREFVRRMLERWTGIPLVNCYELANEPECNSVVGLVNLNKYSIGAMEEADRHGIKLCILNLPEGNPGSDGVADPEQARAIERDKLSKLFPAVQYAAFHGHYVGLHAYWRPGIEGPGGRWHALGRVVWTVQQWQAMGPGLDDLQVLINETGIDGGIAGGPPRTGWRMLNPGGYLDEVVEAEVFARRYPWMQSLMLFTAGWEEPWLTYNHDEAAVLEIATRLPREEEEMLPDWMQDIRERVNYDTGRRRERMIGITVHHDGNRDRPSLANLLTYYKRGEAEDSYHFLIGADGSVWYLNALNRIVWHAGDTALGSWNRGGVAVVFHGYLMGQGRPTEAQFASFRRLRKWLREERLVPEIVISHKEARVPKWSTQCPGDWWPNIEGFVPSELLQAPPPQPYDYEALYIQAMLERGQALDAIPATQDELGRALEATRAARGHILRLEEILKGEGG